MSEAPQPGQLDPKKSRTMSLAFQGNRRGSLALAGSMRGKGAAGGLGKLDSIGLASGMTESHEKLLMELNGRVRQLVNTLRVEEDRRIQQARDHDTRVSGVRKEVAAAQRRYHVERDAHAVAQEELDARADSVHALEQRGAHDERVHTQRSRRIRRSIRTEERRHRPARGGRVEGGRAQRGLHEEGRRRHHTREHRSSDAHSARLWAVERCARDDPSHLMCPQPDLVR